MRKGRLTVAVVGVLVVLGVGYLGAQAYASHRFERELVRTLETLQGEGQWQASREAVERGWFHSQGRVLLAHADNDAWRATIPYDARHGLLSTRLSGALQAYLEADPPSAGEQTLFGDLLPSAEPRWTATFHTLDRRTEGRLDVAAFELVNDSERLAFTGAEFNLEGRAEDLAVHGQVAPLRLSGGGRELVTGSLHVNGRYQLGGDRDFFHQRNELILDRLDYRSPQRPPLTLTGLRYSDETRLDDQLRLDISLSLEQASLAGESLFAGHLEASLDRIDGEAARQLLGEIETAIEAYGGDLSGLDEAQRQALVERLEPALLAALDDSPRFILEGATLASPMFGIESLGNGELIFDGDGADALSVTDLYRNENFTAWRERLNGRFTWQGVPSFLNLQLGLPLQTQTYEVSIDSGEIRINNHPLPALF